jgi:hypothetical protein
VGKRTSVYLTPARQARVDALGVPLPDVLDAGLSALEHERPGPPVTRRETVTQWPKNPPPDLEPFRFYPDPMAPGRSLSAGEQQAAMGEARRRPFVAESLTVTAPGCAHPRSARDPKNPSRCRCGALNLPVPG